MHILPYLLKRTEDTNNRHYYKYGEADRFYKSVTTWQREVLPTDPGLLRWMKNMTAEEQAQVLLESSHKGTFLHERSKEYADQQRSFAIQHLPDYVDEYLAREPELNRTDVRGWADRASNWLYSLNAFFTERNVEPLIYHNEVLESDELMTEIALAYDGSELMIGDNDKTISGLLDSYALYPAFPFAGAIDLVCELDFNGSRQTAIVDYKSGSIWGSHPYQLEAYKLLVESNFDIEIDLIFNWSDKDWNKQKQPTYTLTNQTGKVSPQEMAGLYIVANERSKPNPSPYLEYEDIIKGEGTWTVLPATEYYQEGNNVHK